MAQPARHDLDVYGAKVYIVATRKQWATVAAEIDHPDQAMPEAAGHVWYALWVPKIGISVPHVVIYIDRKAHRDDIAALVNTIAHEADHAAGRILDHAGQRYDADSEAHAYLVGWFAERIWEHVT